jgi:hypothetical protein
VQVSFTLVIQEVVKHAGFLSITNIKRRFKADMTFKTLEIQALLKHYNQIVADEGLNLLDLNPAGKITDQSKSKVERRRELGQECLKKLKELGGYDVVIQKYDGINFGSPYVVFGKTPTKYKYFWVSAVWNGDFSYSTDGSMRWYRRFSPKDQKKYEKAQRVVKNLEKKYYYE